MKKIIIIFFLFIFSLCYAENSEQLNIFVNKYSQKNINLKNWCCGKEYKIFIDKAIKDIVIFRFLSENLSYIIQIEKITNLEKIKNIMKKNKVYELLKDKLKNVKKFPYPNGKIVCKSKNKIIDEQTIRKLIFYAKKVINEKIKLKSNKISLEKLKENSFVLKNCYNAKFVKNLIKKRKISTINFLKKYIQIKNKLKLKELDIWYNLY